MTIDALTVSRSLSSMSVFVNLTAFSRMVIHNLIKLSPNSESSGILDTASDTIFYAKGNNNENIILLYKRYTIYQS